MQVTDLQSLLHCRLGQLLGGQKLWGYCHVHLHKLQSLLAVWRQKAETSFASSFLNPTGQTAAAQLAACGCRAASGAHC